jgi:hypothetical protein
MPSSLRSRLGDLATAFAASIVDVIRGSSVEELFEQSGSEKRGSSGAAVVSRRRAGRLPRRTGQDIEAVIEQIIELLRQNPKGMRAEEIRSSLGLEPKEMPRPLKEGLEAGRFTKSGQKRATTYLLKGSKGLSAGKRRGRATSARRKPRAGKRSSKPATKKETAVPETSSEVS